MCCGVVPCVLHNHPYSTGRHNLGNLPSTAATWTSLTGVLFCVRSSSWLSAVMKRPCLFRLIEHLDWRLPHTKRTPSSLPVVSTDTGLKSSPPLAPARKQYYSTRATIDASTMPRLNPVSQVLFYYYHDSPLYPASHVPPVQLQLPF